MVQLVFAGLGALLVLAALAGFLRGLWVVKPDRDASASGWSQTVPDADHSGHGADMAAMAATKARSARR
jgi:hypothetical protein